MRSIIAFLVMKRLLLSALAATGEPRRGEWPGLSWPWGGASQAECSEGPLATPPVAVWTAVPRRSVLVVF
jgi:hypothetical protein